MKKWYSLVAVLALCSLSVWAMTDQEVINYIKQQTAAGKTEQQIGKELMARGVTPEQAQRVKQLYQKQQAAASNSSLPSSKSPSSVRYRNASQTGNQSYSPMQNQANAADRRHDNASEFDQETYEIIYPDAEGEDIRQLLTSQIYGHNVFNNQALTFEPSTNLATPQNYRLGPGDEVIIDIWGASEDHLRETISPEGSIMISQLGPVYLNGLTISDAAKHVKNAFSQKYAGVDDSETDIQVTLGQVRTIQVNLMGELMTPGTYRMSPFSTVFHALYRAGGINDIGSMRNIQVMRNGKKIAGIDVYEYLFDGKTGSDIRLQEGDVIIVPPYENLVKVEGNVKRPMLYEVKPGETINDVLDYAGGLSSDAYSEMIRLSRQSDVENVLHNISRDEFATYPLVDGDIISVGTILDRFANRVELKGSVNRPGTFAINDNLKTLGQLIEKADGLTEDAFLDRALIYREGDDLSLEVIPVNIGSLLAGTVQDITLKRNDMVVISSVQELFDRGDLTISGMITNPGKYPYADNMTLEDLIVEAGGLLNGASTARVDIVRRIYDPSATTPTQMLSQVYSVSVENGLAVGDDKGFLLKPYDNILIRTSPGYVVQRYVTIKGEVIFDGQYALQKRNERISDVIKRAGGVLDEAYIKGAHMTRKLTEDEYAARQEALRLAIANSDSESGDSIALSKIQVSPSYNVGIDLEKALANPGSSYDIVLQEGDEIYIPEQQSTVKISGEVMFPNAVVYVPGKKLKHYIDQAGGYGQRAKKGSVFVVYLNGTVARGKGSTPIEPGCQIIVPTKPDKSGTDWTKILTFATSLTSVATMAATVSNLFKK